MLGEFSCLNRANLRINESKSKFGMKKIMLLGFLISEHGISPDNSKVDAILRIKPPKNAEELRTFLGKCNYLRFHIPGYAHIAASLEKLRNSKKFIWGKTEEKAFVGLQEAIQKANILSVPNPNFHFFATDASNNGIGSMLYQLDNQKFKFISFDSRVLNKAERNYSTPKKKC